MKLRGCWGFMTVKRRKEYSFFVAKKDAAALIPLIRAHVKAGSIIWTDQWQACAGLGYYYEHQ